MNSEIIYEILAIFLIILANGFFSLSEFSIIASRKSRLQQLVEKKKKGAKTAELLNRKPEKFLATIQVGITLMATLAGVFGGATLVLKLEKYLKSLPLDFLNDASRPISVVFVTLVITISSVVLGELVPKYLALSHPEKYALKIARPSMMFIKTTSFFSNILTALSNGIIKMFGIKIDSHINTINEEEINMMINDGKQKGIFDETEEKLVKSVFDFADSTVRRALTPRTDVEAINIDADPKEIIKTIITHGYSRYPIYEKSLDNIIGILYTKDIIVHKVNPELIILKDLLRTPIFVPDSMPLSNLLNIFQKQKQHIAIVLDEFGGTAGVITLEDLLEELVGEIQDEYDTERAPLIRHSDTVAYAEGHVWPGDINKLLNCKLPVNNIDTIAGLVIDKLGRFPEKDEQIEFDDVTISVLEKEENRLVRLKVEYNPENPEETSEK